MESHLIKHIAPAALPADGDSGADVPLYAGTSDTKSPCGAGVQVFGDQCEPAGVGDDFQQYIEEVIEAEHSPWNVQAAEFAFDSVCKFNFFFSCGLI